MQGAGCRVDLLRLVLVALAADDKDAWIYHEIGSGDWFMRLVQQGYDLLRLVLVALESDHERI